jgi:sugar lactone lactonase YvrE
MGGPNGLAFDSAGNLFVATSNPSHEFILKFTPGGAVSTFASGLNGPNGLAFDSAGNLYVTTGDNKIVEYFSGGGHTDFATGLDIPFGLAFDSAGYLYVANFDRSTSNIEKFSPDGLSHTEFAHMINNPRFLAFEPVPEPPTFVLAALAAGIFALVAYRRRQTGVLAAG